MGDEGFFAYKPIRVILTGDKTAGKAFIPAAQRKLADLDKSLTFQNLQQGFAEHVLDDGCTCTVRNTLEERVIFIDHVPTVPIEKKLDWPEPEVETCVCSANFAECEILGITMAGNGSSPLFGGYDQYCVCYDVLICAYLQEDENEDRDERLDENGMILWERVRPSDFTRYRSGDKAMVIFDRFSWENYQHFPDGVAGSRYREGKDIHPCFGFTDLEMDPDSGSYMCPVIIPVVARQNDYDAVSYKPVIGNGIVESMFDPFEDKEHAFFGEVLELASFHSDYRGEKDKDVPIYRAMGSVAYTDSSYGVPYQNGYSNSPTQPVYPTIDTGKAGGFYFSVWDENSWSEGFGSPGDCMIARSFRKYTNATHPEYNIDVDRSDVCRIAYRNRNYKESDSIGRQLIGGSLAFDYKQNSPLLWIATHKTFYSGIDINNTPVKRERSDYITTLHYIVGNSDQNLGSLPVGFINGETVGRTVLQPATMWLYSREMFTTSEVGYEDEEKEDAFYQFQDVRTGSWPTDLWAYASGGGVRHINRPSTGEGKSYDPISESDLTLFHEMFVHDVRTAAVRTATNNQNLPCISTSLAISGLGNQQWNMKEFSGDLESEGTKNDGFLKLSSISLSNYVEYVGGETTPVPENSFDTDKHGLIRTYDPFYEGGGLTPKSGPYWYEKTYAFTIFSATYDSGKISTISQGTGKGDILLPSSLIYSYPRAFEVEFEDIANKNVGHVPAWGWPQNFPATGELVLQTIACKTAWIASRGETLSSSPVFCPYSSRKELSGLETGFYIFEYNLSALQVQDRFSLTDQNPGEDWSYESKTIISYSEGDDKCISDSSESGMVWGEQGVRHEWDTDWSCGRADTVFIAKGAFHIYRSWSESFGAPNMEFDKFLSKGASLFFSYYPLDVMLSSGPGSVVSFGVGMTLNDYGYSPALLPGNSYVLNNVSWYMRMGYDYQLTRGSSSAVLYLK